MKHPTLQRRFGRALVWLATALACLGPPGARAVDAELQKAIARGSEAFLHDSFGAASGRVCNTCHLAGGTQPGKLPNGKAIPSLSNAAAIFPRVREQDHALITLPDQIRSCVAGAIQGQPPEYGSETLNALVSYVTSLAQGRPIDMGGPAR